jgi:hypothetical protein
MYPSISSAKLSVNVRPSGLSLVLMGISAAPAAPVCTENLIRVDVAMESPKLAE